MANILEIIKNEIAQDYYKNNFPNDGQQIGRASCRERV